MRMPRSLHVRTRFVLVAASVALVVQTAARPAEAESPPTLDEHFTLTLSPPRDYAIREFTKSLERSDELRRSKELEAANAPILSSVLDLLRYVPIRFSASDDSVDFFTPGYLRPDYPREPRAAPLFPPP